ncbi:hypothetical protein A1O3_07369 [Capronia epimyces CBS 606.96]|uniref:Uncharacterized protein n=1 Tax=Capronia epimyces CBS 606.96 TaxID=1182542 RepID=W9XVQ1_9EURO|nr:uncharacterized protein A1O3_07369 [Capronia epimyces CBS 606.96]EXJ81081.1 hypothetical protein A1O3_07369 [Capronia epimyces CBS 606.96]
MPLDPSNQLKIGRHTISLIYQLLTTAELAVPNPENSDNPEFKVLSEVSGELYLEMEPLMEKVANSDLLCDEHIRALEQGERLVKERIRRHKRLIILKKMKLAANLASELLDNPPGLDLKDLYDENKAIDDHGNNNDDAETVNQDLDEDPGLPRRSKRKWEKELDIKIQDLEHLRKRLREFKE